MNKLSLMLVLALVSCGKAPSLPESTRQRVAVPLTGKSTSEVLNLKYSNQVALNCEVRVQQGEKINLNAAPVDRFSWDIPSELSVLRMLSYKIGNKETIVVVRLSKPIEIIEDLTHVSERKQEFYLQYSPALTISYRRAAKTILTNGSVHDRQYFSDTKLYENIEGRLFTMTSEDSNDELVTEDVRCMLTTKFNPGYTDQWTRIK